MSDTHRRLATVTPIDRRRTPSSPTSAAPLLSGAQRSACESAAETRRRYLRDLITGARPLHEAMRLAVARHVLVTATGTGSGFALTDPVGYVEWLGVVIDANATEPDLEEALERAVDVTQDPHRAMLAVLAADQEPPLIRTASWTPAALSRAGGLRGPRLWLELLGGPLRYPWTAWERTRLADADRALPAAPRDAAPRS